MFAKFKMELDDMKYELDDNFDYFYKIGCTTHKEQQKSVYSSLQKYLSPKGVLNASEIEKDWFPTIKADVFLSHSHKDERDVIALAGIFKEVGLTAFIDSCVWGYANDLLKMIDEEYCVQLEKPNGGYVYDYDTRNYSTAHVHMILNGALAKMIDTTECLIFLNTPNSLAVSDLNKGITNSCWIYSELLYSKLLRKRVPIRKGRSFQLNESVRHGDLGVEYDVDISHLIKLEFSDIIEVVCRGQKDIQGKRLLDYLYYGKGLLKR